MKQAEGQAGPCTILINNAGIVTGKKLLEGSDEMQELTMAVNATAHFWTAKAVLPSMLANDHGHIVTVSSITGMVGAVGLADYSASKAAAFYFDESISLEMHMLGKASRLRRAAYCVPDGYAPPGRCERGRVSRAPRPAG